MVDKTKQTISHLVLIISLAFASAQSLANQESETYRDDHVSTDSPQKYDSRVKPRSFHPLINGKTRAGLEKLLEKN